MKAIFCIAFGLVGIVLGCASPALGDQPHSPGAPHIAPNELFLDVDLGTLASEDWQLRRQTLSQLDWAGFSESDLRHLGKHFQSLPVEKRDRLIEVVAVIELQSLAKAMKARSEEKVQLSFSALFTPYESYQLAQRKRQQDGQRRALVEMTLALLLNHQIELSSECKLELRKVRDQLETSARAPRKAWPEAATLLTELIEGGPIPSPAAAQITGRILGRAVPGSCAVGLVLRAGLLSR